MLDGQSRRYKEIEYLADSCTSHPTPTRGLCNLRRSDTVLGGRRISAWRAAGVWTGGGKVFAAAENIKKRHETPSKPVVV
jgi:hypothetical protein